MYGYKTYRYRQQRIEITYEYTMNGYITYEYTTFEYTTLECCQQRLNNKYMNIQRIGIYM